MPLRPAKDQNAYLSDMVDSAKKATAYVRGQTYENFWDDPKTRDAVAMRLECRAGRIEAHAQGTGQISPRAGAPKGIGRENPTGSSPGPKASAAEAGTQDGNVDQRRQHLHESVPRMP